MQITTIGLDIAKNVFQVHGIDASEKVFVRKQLRRSQVLAFFKALPPCLVGICGCIAMEVSPPFEDRPDTWPHPNASQISQIPLAPRAPSIHGP